jgi:hypothetical protein
LESVIRNYREVGRPEWVTDEVSRPEIFFHRSLDFCTRTIGRYAPTAKRKTSHSISATSLSSSTIRIYATWPVAPFAF